MDPEFFRVRPWPKGLFILRFFLLFGFMSGTFSCAKDDPPAVTSSGPSNTWVIPQDEVLRGAEKDGIKSLDNPLFNPVDETAFLRDDDRLLVFAYEDKIRAYPIQILDWHEIVNDRMGENAITVTYCPLTGTGIGWLNPLTDKNQQFGVSGLLFQANMIAYDRATDSHWSQMRLQCVNGSEIGTGLRQQALVTLSWQYLRSTFPQAQILSDQTGFDLPYSSYPYGDYRENHDFYISPVTFDDDRRQAKEEMMGIIILDDATVFPRASFPDDEVTLVNLVLGGQPLVLYFDPSEDIMVAFKSNFEGRVHQFSLDGTDGYPLVDENGAGYDIFGNQDNGTAELQSPKMFSGFWFAWTKFYPRVEIYEGIAMRSAFFS